MPKNCVVRMGTVAQIELPDWLDEYLLLIEASATVFAMCDSEEEP